MRICFRDLDLPSVGSDASHGRVVSFGLQTTKPVELIKCNLVVIQVTRSDKHGLKSTQWSRTSKFMEANWKLTGDVLQTSLFRLGLQAFLRTLVKDSCVNPHYD